MKTNFPLVSRALPSGIGKTHPLAISGASFLICIANVAAKPRELHSANGMGPLRPATDEVSLRFRSGKDEIQKVPQGTVAAEMASQRLRNGNAQVRELQPVYYPLGRPANLATRHQLTHQVAVEKDAGFRGQAAAADKFAAKVGAIAWQAPSWARGKLLLTFPSQTADILGVMDRLRAMEGVLTAEPVFARPRQKRLVPNDPYFADVSSQPGYQWHLRNLGTRGGVAGIDVNVTGVWDTFLGTGVSIGIVDDGLDLTHPDLIPNLNTTIDFDWNGDDATPQNEAGDEHGNACAGVAAARGNNNVGVSGAAPRATIVGMRLISGSSSDVQEAAAVSHESGAIHIKSNSWGPFDDGVTVEGPGPFTTAALEEAVAQGRGGLGTLFFWSGGNGRREGDDSNYDGYANAIQAIAIGAVGDTGQVADYSERGANLLVCAPSNGNNQSITTVDNVGTSGYNGGGNGDFADNSYTNSFGGTSSACPLAAGCAALLLEANPNLGWRDVKEILVRSSRKVSPTSAGWFYNGANFDFHDDFGAGMIDATAMVNLAAGWVKLPAMTTHQVTQQNLNQSISPNGGSTSVSFTVAAGANQRVEQIKLAQSTVHSDRGDLRFELTSPSGTTSVLADFRKRDTAESQAWAFSTPQFWGELSVGTWTLRVLNGSSTVAGTLQQATLHVYGTPATSLPLAVLTGTRRLTLSQAVATVQPLNASNAASGWLATGLPMGLSIDASTGTISGTPVQSGTSTAQITITNATGDATYPIQITIVPPLPALANAIELDGKFVASTDATPWQSVVGAESHDGVDAARSGAIPHNASTALYAEMEGPGQLSFWWSVSSELNYDFLSLEIDNVRVARISGTQAWANFTTNISAGTHTVRWKYEKDGVTAEGSDAGWVDEVTLAIATGIPVFTSATSAASPAHLAFQFELAASQYPTSFSATNLPPGLALNTFTGMISGTPSAAGSYSVPISATNQFGTATGTLVLNISAGTSLADAIDQPNISLVSSSPAWSPTISTTYDQVDAVVSPDIQDEESTSLSTSFFGPRIVTFWWKVSSEANYDYLEFLVDGTVVKKISGEVAWSQVSHAIYGGTQHTITWRYVKDSLDSDGSDLGWVDALTFSGPNTLPTVTSPTALLASTGVPFAHAISATELPESFAATGLPAWATLDTASGLISGTPLSAGVHPINISATNIYGTGDMPTVILVQTLTDGQAVATEALGLPFVSQAANSWFPQSSVVSPVGNSLALQSAPIDDSSSSVLQATVTGPGVVRFWWKVSSEQNYDFLRFSVNGVLAASRSGEFDWQQFSHTLAAGTHNLRWTYSKDAFSASGEDTAWVDRITPPAIDTDGDGFTNTQEAWYGTQGTNAASQPTLFFVAPTDGSSNVAIPAIPGRIYSIWHSADLIQWDATYQLSTGSQALFPGPQSNRTFFRLTRP